MQADICGGIKLYNADVINLYKSWDSPVVIISDGPYGISGFRGDLPTSDKLDEWYEPHIKSWSDKSTGLTTLWFWNTEIGWATVHPILKRYGWDYVNCHVWNKGISHVAGNTNTKTLRKFPVVTELCIQYTRKQTFSIGEKNLSIKDWLRYEWERTGLSFYKTNEACGVKNAATRKYFTKCHLWYFPPVDAFVKLVEYANKYGKEEGKPYFSLNNERPISGEEWEKMRSKFYCPVGVTNVWSEPSLNGKERLKIKGKAIHLNQKPLKLIERIITSSSDKGDLIWDPFGGIFTVALACMRLDRLCLSAEIDSCVFNYGSERIRKREELFASC